MTRSTSIPDPQSIDFLDFGASKGHSIDFAKRLFSFDRGVGVDNDPHKVRMMHDAGYECIQADLTNLDWPEKSVKLVVISHLLEHLSDLEEVAKVLETAKKTATDFIFVVGPSFDDDDYLASLGLRFFWSDWTGHTLHLTTDQFVTALERVGLNDYVLMGSGKVLASQDNCLLPLSAPRDQHHYDPQKHPPKAQFKIDGLIIKEFLCCIRLREFPQWTRFVSSVQKTKHTFPIKPRRRSP